MIPFKPALHLLSRGRLTILILHRVHERPDPLFPDEPDAARFDDMMGWVKSWFNVLPLDQAARQLASGTLPPRSAAITFDDGYADNYTQALPILRRHGLCATFFIATAYLDGGCMWNDRIINALRRCQLRQIDLRHLGLGCYTLDSAAAKRLAIDALLSGTKYLSSDERLEQVEHIAKATAVDEACQPMMTSAQTRALHRAGMQIGAHTVSHPILAGLDIDSARNEIARSKIALEQLIGEEISAFAYPNGKPGVDYRPEHADLVRQAGFTCAVSTAWGAARTGDDLFQLPRFTPWGRTRLPFALQLMKNLR